ncbi:piggyBac transposable element-derived protein 4-like [Amphiura filiformis]|uniref:piggyBac transposable element-derived protein 4-like n=1 Tax=Amphiura filiformis TaxID=82378 RepID=UPI003B22330E
MDLLEAGDIVDKGHHVFMDNLFSSPTLFHDLADRDTGACGTLRRNRFGTPEVIKRANPRKEDPPVFHRDGKLLFTTWKDRSMVTVVSSVHSDETLEKRTRCRASDTGWQERDKPKMIEMYTKFMRGVDWADQQMWYSLLNHKSVKWWKKILFGLLEVTFTNTMIILKSLRPGARIDRNKVRMSIVSNLTRGYRRGLPAQVAPQPDERLVPGVGRHMLDFVSKKSEIGNLLRPDLLTHIFRHVGIPREQVRYLW